MVYEIKVVRSVLKEDAPQLPVRTARAVYDYAMKHCYKSEEMWRESAWLLLLNKSGEVFGQFLLSTGGTDECNLDKKVVAKVAIDMMAAGVIIVHNHPSGNCLPSQTDIRQTADVKRALSLFDIQLLDHVVIGENEYFSFNDENRIKL